MRLIKRPRVATLVASLMVLIGATCTQKAWCIDPADAPNCMADLPADANPTQSAATAASRDNADDQGALQGSVSLTRSITPEALSQSLDELTNKAVENNAEYKELDKLLNKHQTIRAAAVHKIKDSMNFAFFIRGNGPSAEAGDVILEEKIKVKDHASAEYAKQRLADKLHLEVISRVMQLAEAVGNPDKEAGKKQIHCGMKHLEALVGPEAAQKMLNNLVSLNAVPVPERIYQQKPWTITKSQRKVKRALETSLQNDAVVSEITARIHKYNKRSKKYYVSTSVVKTALGLGALTPSIVGTACSLAEYSFIMATGGPEEDKIIKELYLDKRLQSHGKVLSEEAYMAVYGYQMGRMTRNPALLLCSQSVLRHMVGKENVPDLLEYSKAAVARVQKGEEFDAPPDAVQETKPTNETSSAGETAAPGTSAQPVASQNSSGSETAASTTSASDTSATSSTPQPAAGNALSAWDKQAPSSNADQKAIGTSQDIRQE